MEDWLLRSRFQSPEPCILPISKRQQQNKLYKFRIKLPTTILKQITKIIETRLSKNSSYKNLFNNIKKDYNDALNINGYNYEINYTEECKNKKRNRKINITKTQTISSKTSKFPDFTGLKATMNKLGKKLILMLSQKWQTN